MANLPPGKLIRDGIPDLMRAGGIEPALLTLDRPLLILALRQKLLEETRELLESETPAKLLEETGDVLQVVEDIFRLHGYTLLQLLSQKEAKMMERGGFKEGIFLMDTSQRENT